MDGYPPPLPAEDHADEDFFDKLVRQEESASAVQPLATSGSNDVEPAARNSELVQSPGDESASAHGSPPQSTGPEMEVDSHGGAVKETGVKVVQWSAFHVEPQQAGTGDGFGFDSDFLAGNGMQESYGCEAGGFSEHHSSEPSTSWSSQETQTYGSMSAQDAQDMDNLYPGWKYDYNTGNWYQVGGFDASISGSNSNDVNAAQSSSMSYSKQTSHSVLGTIVEDPAEAGVANWNYNSQENPQYPSNMLFDPQYPGWYYDTNTQQWYTLDSYNHTATSSMVTTLQDHLSRDLSDSNGFATQQAFNPYATVGQHVKQSEQTQGSHHSGGGWCKSTNNHLQGDWSTPSSTSVQQNARQTVEFDKDNNFTAFKVNHEAKAVNDYLGNANRIDQHLGFRTAHHLANQSHGNNALSNGFHGFLPKEDSSSRSVVSQTHQQVGFNPVESLYAGSGSLTGCENVYQYDKPKLEHNMPDKAAHTIYDNQKSNGYSNHMFQGGGASFSHFSHVSNIERSSAGRPPHALATFGFGGKLILMKEGDYAGTKSDFRGQGTTGATISIIDLMDVVMHKPDGSSISSNKICNYFNALAQQSLPGPLVGGNAAAKDINRWLDERIATCDSSSVDFCKELLNLLLSLLKISCQHYGKLRSPFGADQSLEQIEGPEGAVSKLFASAANNAVQSSNHGSIFPCMKNVPKIEQLQATALEVQSLLVSGRRKEALQIAQVGHLWGPALVLAAQLGEKFYVDTVKKMAQNQLIPGSPLRTLCLLIAGQPADVFSVDDSANFSASEANSCQQTTTQLLNSGMLDDWQAHLAIITANRTKDDELVMIHLGDCLWKERGEVIAAHTCYLVAEANFESYSDSSRLCLIGADHLKFPRTYASPEAIQRTEIYEYSKVLGNSQFVLLPFQPYKLIYTCMLAEVGKLSDSLRYCQAALKSLKNSSRAPEIEMCKSLLSSLEERLRTHQQGGYSTNLAIVGKFFNRSIHRIIGAPLPALPHLPHNNVNGKESYSIAPKVSGSQSTMAMSSLVPSASVEAIHELTGSINRKSMHNRSISEPDFGSPKQALPKNSGSPDSERKLAGGPSRLGQFGSQLIQKTMGWVSRSRPDRQAKLGETNKFYYDGNLKRWVEEGVEPPAEEAAIPPPPTTNLLKNGMADYNINNAFNNQCTGANGGLETKSSCITDQKAGIPPIPSSTNQFSARSRMAVRSRYVDTYNKGGGSTSNTFQATPISSAKSVLPSNIFIPTPHAATDEQPINETSREHGQEAPAGEPSPSLARQPFLTSPSSSSIQRYPSMDCIAPLDDKSFRPVPQNADGSFTSHTRAASWSGAYMEMMPTSGDRLGDSLNYNTSKFLTSSSSVQTNGGCVGDDLHEVEL